MKFGGYYTISLQNSKLRILRFREMPNMSIPKETVRFNAKNTCTNVYPHFRIKIFTSSSKVLESLIKKELV